MNLTLARVCDVVDAYYKLWYDGEVVVSYSGNYDSGESITVPGGQLGPPSTSTSCDSGHEFRLELQTDDWGEEISWKVENSNGNTVLQGGDYPDQSLVEITDCLGDDGVYTFTIMDSYGDGMCCGKYRYLV